ncbi:MULTISPECIES: hypothetical protein [Achromobacter]|uniref:hypothetical protein n=1 Tax=Achromobacter sp. ACM03 TaxID=2769300 RepID=UPI001CE08029|nr:hypothetical protein [Achromobacter sp. ACM03]
MTHAGGGSGWGHSTAGGGTGGSDVQPLAPSINISPKAVIFDLRTAQPPIRGPLGPRVSFIDLGHGGVTPLQNLSRRALGIGYMFSLVALPLSQLAAVEGIQDEPGCAGAQQHSCRVSSPAGQSLDCGGDHARPFQSRGIWK